MLSAQTYLIAPVAIADIDLEEPRELALDARYRSVLVLVRRAGEPLGLIAMPRDEHAVGFEAIAAEAARQLDGRVTGRINPPPPPVGTRPPALSVVVTTCALPKRAIRCARSILACETSPLEVIVVENRPGRVATAQLIGTHFAGDERVRCIEEPRAGLSSARNAGLWSARGDVVAFTDDDVIADGDWTGAITTAFARTPEAMCVTGADPPARARGRRPADLRAARPLRQGVRAPEVHPRRSAGRRSPVSVRGRALRLGSEHLAARRRRSQAARVRRAAGRRHLREGRRGPRLVRARAAYGRHDRL